jgi:predicted FMN-binding regulatory protein PaiB
MFVPEQFKITDPADVLALMQANPFAHSSATIPTD